MKTINDEIKVATRIHRISLIIKSILVLLSLCFCGCAVLSPSTDGLKHSNNNFESWNERQLHFTENSSVKVDFLGKHNGAYLYKTVDNKGQEVFFHLPVKNGETALITLDKPVYSNKTGKTAKFYFYENNKQPYFKMIDPCTTRISTDTALDKTSEYPTNVFVKVYVRYYIRDGVDGHAMDFHEIKYASKEGNFSNNSKKQTGLSAYDSVVLGARNMGYLITVPIDAALTVAFAPFSLFIPRCGMWGCP